MKLICNKFFSLHDLDKINLESFYINKEYCLLIVDDKLCEVDQFYLNYAQSIIQDIQSILVDNNYTENQFYLLQSNQISI